MYEPVTVARGSFPASYGAWCAFFEPSRLLLKQALSRHFARRRVGRPHKHTVWTMLIVTLIKLRGETVYKSLEVYLRIDSITLHRYVNRVCAILAQLPLGRVSGHQYLIVDGTCTRVRSTEEHNHSGYKHHKNRKVQMLVDDRRRVVAVSKCYNGAVHDKTIWNRELSLLLPKLDRPILGDKGYAGSAGENSSLFRPIKRNELEYKNNKAVEVFQSPAVTTASPGGACVCAAKIVQDTAWHISIAASTLRDLLQGNCFCLQHDAG
jgi:hypothetical protein